MRLYIYIYIIIWRATIPKHCHRRSGANLPKVIIWGRQAIASFVSETSEQKTKVILNCSTPKQTLQCSVYPTGTAAYVLMCSVFESTWCEIPDQTKINGERVLQPSTFLLYRLLLQSCIHIHGRFFLFEVGKTCGRNICGQQIHSHGDGRIQLHSSDHGEMC